MGKFEDLLDLLLTDDDDEDGVTIDIHLSDDAPDEKPEEPKGKYESKPSDEDDPGEELRKKAMEQHQSIVEEFGKVKADEIVDFAASCATIAALIRQNIPIEQKIVDEYNALCEDLYPEHCTPFAKKVMYMALHEMMEDGKKNFK